MRKTTLLFYLFHFQISGILFANASPDWGFFGHRLINKMAIFTLPEELFGFYKMHHMYMTDHAVDPDKRRYASKFEAHRHYIDLDVWYKKGSDPLPTQFSEAIMRHASYLLVVKKDTFSVQSYIIGDSILFCTPPPIFCEFKCPVTSFVQYWQKVIMPLYYDDVWMLSGADLNDYFYTNCFPPNVQFLIKDNFSEHGILPYFLQEMQHKLTMAFSRKDMQQVLRLSAELGHYLGDAHVPLHTTENYNGQLTGQTGIHAFWESRIPELFAEEEYDFLLKEAEYIGDKPSFFWNIIQHAHSLVEDVLSSEKFLSQKVPGDRQYCYDERMGKVERMPCRKYAKAWSNMLGKSIEQQMRSAMQALGNCIYTAWVDAGQPVIAALPVIPEKTITKEDQLQNRVVVRPHESDL